MQKLLEQNCKVWKANVDTLGKKLEGEIKKYEKGRTKNSDKKSKLVVIRLKKGFC